MTHALKMPDAFARLRLQSKQAVCKQVVANAVGAVEIKCGRARGNVYDSTLGIDRHARPVVSGAARFPGIFRPGVVTELARMRNGVERPAQLAAAHIVGADVTERRR